jgi:protein-disulfide isomerase
VLEDLRSGARSGVQGTPSYFINGIRHEGNIDYDTLLGAIEEATGTAAARRWDEPAQSAGVLE